MAVLLVFTGVCGAYAVTCKLLEETTTFDVYDRQSRLGGGALEALSGTRSL